MNNYPEIQELLQQRADLYARLKVLAYDGTPEIKENKSGKYLYVPCALILCIVALFMGIAF